MPSDGAHPMGRWGGGGEVTQGQTPGNGDQGTALQIGGMQAGGRGQNAGKNPAANLSRAGKYGPELNRWGGEGVSTWGPPPYLRCLPA